MKVIKPHFIAILMAIILILFSLVDPQDYSYKIGEVNYMYKNFGYYFYIILCTTAFTVGSIYTIRLTKDVNYTSFFPSRLTVIGIGILGIAISAFKILYLYLNFGFSKILASYGGSEAGYLVKDDLNDVISGGKIGWVTDTSIIFIITLAWLSISRKDKYGRFFFFLNILLFLFISLISLSRDALVSVIIAYLFIYLSNVKGNFLSRFKKYFFALFIGIFIFTAFFVVIDSARNSLDRTNQLVTQLYGYFPASVNRGAAIYDEKLRYPNSNSGYYSTQFIWDFPILSSLLKLPLSARSYGLDIPIRPEENWNQQFKAVYSYGLNRKYIWATVFGFVYADFGNMGIVYFFIYGLLCGAFFNMYRQGSIFGIIMYTFSVITIYKWGSVISFSQRAILIGIILSFAISLVATVKIRAERRTKNEKIHPNMF